MTQRITRSSVTFRHPFLLSAFDTPQPAGTYRIETYEDLIEGVSFPAYLRIETLMELQCRPGQPPQLVAVDPAELEAAHGRDTLTEGDPVGPGGASPA